jgi:tetratricopeptide (TPR) repeat protein
MARQTIYTVGGTVQAGEGIYIKRKADDELLALCRRGEYAFILSSRQVGKSSLMVHTAQQLEKEGVRSAIIDLSAIGVNVSQDQWYLGILNEVCIGLSLETDLFSWWEKHIQFGPALGLTNFFKDVLLKEIDNPVVLFFDEIDTTLSIPFSDDFYVALRAVYNARSTVDDFKRLSFVLGGVAAPSELISDSKRTPFNIGYRVEVNDFMLGEASPLADGFGEQGNQVLTWVLQFTGGHPYLTQRLCAYLADSEKVINDQTVAKAVERLFTSEQGKRQDNNLQFVRDILSSRSPDVIQVMKIYRDVRSGKEVVDDERSIFKAHLKLSGLVRSEQGFLKVRNQIYSTVFNLRWVQENIPRNTTRITAFSLGFVSLVLFSILVYEFFVVRMLSVQYVNNFYNSQTASDKLQYLAKLFDLGGILPSTDYDSSARELFFSLNESDQEALFTKSSLAARNEYLSTVIRGLYVTMANVEGWQDSTTLLQIMKSSLVKDVDPNLYNEIDFWLQARNAPQDEIALERYSSAIELNKDNPALYYERAKVENNLKRYKEALLDLDTTMELAQNPSTKVAEKELPVAAPLPMDTHTSQTSSTSTSTPLDSAVTSVIPSQLPLEVGTTALRQ